MYKYPDNIKNSGMTIYDKPLDDENTFIPSAELEDLLRQGLIGLSLDGLAIRSRSRYVKERICKILGYPVPHSFKRTQPRF